MKLSTLNKAAIFSGLGLAAFAGGVDPVAIGALGPCLVKVIEWMTGIAGNQVHALLSSAAEPPPPNAEEVFRNHHIRTLLQHAIRVIVERTTQQIHRDEGSASPELHAALERLPIQFAEALDKPDSALAGVAEFDVPDLLSRYALAQGKMDVLTLGDWQQFIDDAQPAILLKERQVLAVVLHTQFGDALWNLVKHDASADGQGAAAVELLYLSRILTAVEANSAQAGAPDIRALTDRVAALIQKLDQKQTRFFEKLFAQNGALLNLVQKQIRLAESLPSDVANELERRRLVRPLSAFKEDIGRIIKYAPAELIGREAETKLLSDAWEKAVRAEKGRPHILTFVALGGEGKTSLVAKWAADLAAQDWPGCDAVFAWSFYSQGTREQTAVSSDLFLAEALTFFGDAAMAGSAQGAFEKGRRLAQLVDERRALLILDGLEPLQYAPTSPTPGELKDQGLAALLKGLAATSHGLCVVTTRYALPDLRAFEQTTARKIDLKSLSKEAGVALLKSFKTGPDDNPLRIRGTQAEFEKLVVDVKGHALTLNLLGSYLLAAHAGDIRKRDLIQFREADAANEHPDHATHVMDAYLWWMAPTGFRAWLRRLFSAKEREIQANGKRALALLRLMGFFDRPATADCLAALWKAPAIPGLTEPLIGLSDAQRNLSLKRLEDAKLLTVNRDAPGTLVSLDAHPLLREYFAERLKDAAEPRSERRSMKAEGTPPSSFILPTSSFCLAHRRLYEHLCASTQEGDQPTLEALQPIYQAVAHGCQAGLQQEAHDEVYVRRVRRGRENYVCNKLGAFGAELGALACFFELPWSKPSNKLREPDQGVLLHNASFRLRALGRLIESLEPLRVSGEMDVKVEEWKGAAISYNNLSELELTLGEVAGAVGDAEQSVTYADRSGDTGMRMVMRTTHADALHQAGRRAEAEARFREAEQMQAERQPAYPLLYSLQGFQYCDLLLAEAERAAWQQCGAGVPPVHDAAETAAPLSACRSVSARAAQTLKWAEMMGGQGGLLDPALNHLTLGRAALYAAILDSPDSALRIPISELASAVSGLRRAGTTHHIPRAFLTRAWQRSLTGALTSAEAGPDSAQSDLDEAWEIAERGPMKLFMADIHIYRARLFFREKEYPKPWISPQADLAAAEKLINDCGYHRRDEELADANAAILSK